MFGYVKTDLPNLYMKDNVLYKALYCGLCKGIGKCCGTRGRCVLNYDLTFLSALLHNVMDIDVDIKKEHCILHRIKKRPVAVPDTLTERIANLNVILAHYKVTDDVLDNGKGRIKRALIKKAYRKSKRAEKELDEIVKTRYNELRKLEEQKTDSVDISADPFGNMMTDIVSCLAKEYASEELKGLAYNLGKWIYLIDALDDFDKDKKSNNFNVFVNSNKDILNKNKLVETKKQDLIMLFGEIINNIATFSRGIKYNFNHDLIDNILLRGIPEQTKKIMEN